MRDHPISSSEIYRTDKSNQARDSHHHSACLRICQIKGGLWPIMTKARARRPISMSKAMRMNDTWSSFNKNKMTMINSKSLTRTTSSKKTRSQKIWITTDHQSSSRPSRTPTLMKNSSCMKEAHMPGLVHQSRSQRMGHQTLDSRLKRIFQDWLNNQIWRITGKGRSWRQPKSCSRVFILQSNIWLKQISRWFHLRSKRWPVPMKMLRTTHWTCVPMTVVKLISNNWQAKSNCERSINNQAWK